MTSRDNYKRLLLNPTTRNAALKEFKEHNQKLKEYLFSTLIDLASVGHSDIQLVREVILDNFSKEYLMLYTEDAAEPILNIGDEEEYRRLAELYTLIDFRLLRPLVKDALMSDNSHIYEVGLDYQNEI